MEKYVYQKFLLNRNYNSVDLQKHVLTVTDSNIVQQNYNVIPLSTLDCTVDSEEDLIALVKELDREMPVVLIDDRPQTDNPIIIEYKDSTLKAWLQCFHEQNTDCYWNPPGSGAPVIL